MGKLTLSIFTLLTLIFMSCSDNILPENYEVHKQPSETLINRKVLGDGKHDLLGYGYDPTQGYLEVENYDKLQVIDVNKLLIEQPGHFYVGYPNTSSSKIIAGADAKDWGLDLSNKLSGTIPVDQLTVGMHNDITANYFVSSIYSYATFVMNIILQKEKLYHTLDVLKNYLTPNFINDINTLPASRIIEMYGTHVLIDVTIGGKLQVDYKSFVNSINKENTVNSGVSASVDKVFSLSANNSVGYSYKDFNQDVTCTYKTIGGNAAKTIFGEITDVTQSLKKDLDAWSSTVTLNNSVTVDVGESSLIPIYEFVSDPAKKASLEIAVRNYLSSKLITVVNGALTFPMTLNKSNDRIVSLDYNGDGVKDILCYSPGYRKVCLNSGLLDGSFYNVFMSSNGLDGYDFGSTTDLVNVLDYNGDGKDDLMCYRPGSAVVYILKSNGDGSFTRVYFSSNAQKGIGDYDFSSTKDRAITLDYNGDGYDDMLAYRPGSRIVYLIKSNGNGTFTTVFSSDNGIAGYNFSNTNDKVISFDYNGDGNEDILTYCPGKRIVYINKSNGDGTFTNIYSSSNGLNGFDFSNINDLVIELNYDGDKFPDLLCYRPGSGIVFLLKSKGNSTFENVVQSYAGIAGFDLASVNDKIISIDYDDDNKSDLILYRPSVGTTFSVHSSGNGSFDLSYYN